jgi:large subunit ribosomal protein L11
LLKQAAGLEKGSATNRGVLVGTVTRDQVAEIAQTKMQDLNAFNLEAAMKQIIGTATSMGITVAE